MGHGGIVYGERGSIRTYPRDHRATEFRSHSYSFSWVETQGTVPRLNFSSLSRPTFEGDGAQLMETVHTFDVLTRTVGRRIFSERPLLSGIPFVGTGSFRPEEGETPKGRSRRV